MCRHQEAAQDATQNKPRRLGSFKVLDTQTSCTWFRVCRGNAPCMRRVAAAELVLFLKPDRALPRQQQPDRCADPEAPESLPVPQPIWGQAKLCRCALPAVQMWRFRLSRLACTGGLPSQWSNMTHLLSLDLHQNQLGGMLPALPAPACGALATRAQSPTLPQAPWPSQEVDLARRGPPALVGGHAQPAEDQHLAEQADRCAARAALAGAPALCCKSSEMCAGSCLARHKWPRV